MTRQNWEEWLNRETDDPTEALSRRRFHNLYLDMLEVCRNEYAGANLHALAAYAVWRNTPTALRVPASQIDLAHLLGYTKDDVFRKWRERYPALFSDDRIRSTVRRMVLERIPDVMDASLNCAINGGVQGFQDRKLVLEIAGVYKPTVDTNVTGATVLRLTWGEAGEEEAEPG